MSNHEMEMSRFKFTLPITESRRHIRSKSKKTKGAYNPKFKDIGNMTRRA